MKLGVLLGAAPFHMFIALALINSQQALAANYYRGLHLLWAPDPVADQRLGATLAWGITEVPMLIVMIALLAQWARSDARETGQNKRHLDVWIDPGLDRYGAMLASLQGCCDLRR